MPTFNIEKARQSGASDAEIVDYLSDKFPNFNLSKAKSSGKTNTEIADYLSTFELQSQAENMNQPAVTQVPNWAMKHPNLYGFAGATYEVGKPIAEAIGLGGGAIVGTGALNPVGGAGAGYGIAKQAEQLAGERLGVLPTKTTPERYRQLLKDVMLGAMFQMDGEVANKVIFEPVIKGGKWLFNVGKSIITGRASQTATKQAAKVWMANTSAGPIYAKNRMEAEAIEAEIPGLKFTEGQKTYDPNRIKFERVMFRKPGEAGQKSVEQIAQNDIALKEYYQKNFGGDEGIDDFLKLLNERHKEYQKIADVAKSEAQVLEGDIAGKDIQQIYGNMKEAIKTNKRIVHDSVEKVYNLIPDDIQLNTKSMLKEFENIQKPTSEVENPANIPSILNRSIRKYSSGGMPPKLQEIINAYKRAGKAFPQQLKDEIARYGGKDTLSLKEIRGLRSEILNDIRKESGKTAKNDIKIRRLNQMLDVVESTLDQLADAGQYGEDVSEVYRIASAGWRQYKETYETGTIGQIMQKGPQGEATKLTPEQSLGRIFNKKDLNAADQLNNAVTKKKATELIKEYADYDLLQKTINPQTKEIDKTKLTRWLFSNRQILKKYNLHDSYNGIAKAKDAIEIATENLVEFEKNQAFKMLGVDADKAIKVAFTGRGGTASAKTARELINITKDNPAALAGIKRAFTDNILNEIQTTAKTIEGSPVISNAKFNNIYKKYLPAIREFYKNEPKKLRALLNMKKTYEIMIRNKTSPLGGGSDTFENTITTLYDVVGHAPVGGPLQFRAARSILRIITSFQRSQVDEVLSRAIFDPDVALTLEMIASGIKPEIAQKSFANEIAKLTKMGKLRPGSMVIEPEMSQKSFASNILALTGAGTIMTKENIKNQ